MTLLFAGHDTTTSTLTFLFYELARHPAGPVRASSGRRLRDAAALMGGSPARSSTWRSTRPCGCTRPRGSARARSLEPFEFGGHTCPAACPSTTRSWASHRLPDVWDEPDAFRPERFAPEAQARRCPRAPTSRSAAARAPASACASASSRSRSIAARVLRRFRLELAARHELRIRQTPTIGPRGGLPMVVRAAPEA